MARRAPRCLPKSPVAMVAASFTRLEIDHSGLDDERQAAGVDHEQPSGDRAPNELNHESKSPSKDGYRTPSRHQRLFSAWWLEALACIASLAALLATFATLYHYMDQPSPRWPRWISLNTVVSIYALVLRTAIVFVLNEGIGQLKWLWFGKTSRPLDDLQTWDDATRSPVGASVLIASLRGRQWLASLGALVFVLTLAVDPFAQQLIHYYDCPVVVAGLASIPRAESFHGDQRYSHRFTWGEHCA